MNKNYIWYLFFGWECVVQRQPQALFQVYSCMDKNLYMVSFPTLRKIDPPRTSGRRWYKFCALREQKRAFPFFGTYDTSCSLPGTGMVDVVLKKM